MTNRTHSLKKNNYDFFQQHLTNRYSTIKDEILPKRYVSTYASEIDNSYLLQNIVSEGTPLIDFLSLMFDVDRMEPENPYIYHALSPSARGFQGYTVTMNFSFNGHELNFIYLKNHQDFYLTSGYLQKAYTDKLDITIKLFYDHSNIGSYYGRFGFILSLLDAGHQINHFEKLTNQFNYPVSVIEYLPKNSTINSNFFPLVCLNFEYNHAIDLSLEGDKSLFLESDLRIEEVVDSNFSLFIEEINSYDSLQRGKKEPLLEVFDYDFIVKKRTSLQSYEGLSFSETKEVETIELNKLMELNKKNYSRIDMIIFDLVHKKIICPEEIKDMRDFIDIEKVFYDSMEYISVEKASYLFLTFSKRKTANNSKTVLIDFIQSAELMHEVSIFFSQKDYISRCFRNINDKYVLSKFQQYEYVTYMQIVGINNQNRKLILS